MTLSERLGLDTTVSLRALLNGDQAEVGGSSEISLSEYTEEIISSGFPGIRALSGRARRVRLDGYISRIIDRDFADELGQQVRRPDTLRRWMRAYAAATSTVTSLEKIRDAATHNEATPAKTTVLAYRDALARLFILDPVDGWAPLRYNGAQPSRRHTVRVKGRTHLLLEATTTTFRPISRTPGTWKGGVSCRYRIAPASST